MYSYTGILMKLLKLLKMIVFNLMDKKGQETTRRCQKILPTKSSNLKQAWKKIRRKKMMSQEKESLKFCIASPDVKGHLKWNSRECCENSLFYDSPSPVTQLLLLLLPLSFYRREGNLQKKCLFIIRSLLGLLLVRSLSSTYSGRMTNARILVCKTKLQH